MRYAASISTIWPDGFHGQRQSLFKEDAEVPHGHIRVYGSIRQKWDGWLRIVFWRRSEFGQTTEWRWKVWHKGCKLQWLMYKKVCKRTLSFKVASYIQPTYGTIDIFCPKLVYTPSPSRHYYLRLIAGTKLMTPKGWIAWLAKADCMHITFAQGYYAIESKGTKITPHVNKKAKLFGDVPFQQPSNVRWKHYISKYVTSNWRSRSLIIWLEFYFTNCLSKYTYMRMDMVLGYAILKLQQYSEI